MSLNSIQLLKFRETVDRSMSAPCPSTRLPCLVQQGSRYRFGNSAKALINRFVSISTPKLFSETMFNTQNLNKIFASVWIDSDHVLFGTKCNRLFVLNVRTGSKKEIVTSFWTESDAIPHTFESRAPSPTVSDSATPKIPVSKLRVNTKKGPFFAFELEGTSPNTPQSSKSLPDSFLDLFRKRYKTKRRFSPYDIDNMGINLACTSESEDIVSDFAQNGYDELGDMFDHLCLESDDALEDQQSAFDSYPPKSGRFDPNYVFQTDPTALAERLEQLRSVDADATTEAPAPQPVSCSGIHTISINPSHTLVAVGSGKPVEVSIYSLPTMEPIAILNGHKDLVFSLAWIDDYTLITGSRDKSLRVWRIVGFKYQFRTGTHVCEFSDTDGSVEVDNVQFQSVWSSVLGKHLMMYAPVLTRKQQHYKVRSLCYNHRENQLLSLATDGFVKVWNVNALHDKHNLATTRTIPLVHTAEAVCLEHDPSSNLYAIGSQSHIQFLDQRAGHSYSAGIINVVEAIEQQKGWGVRSAAFGGGDILTIGGGLGGVSFYDLRAQKYLTWPKKQPSANSDESQTDNMLHLSDGYIFRDELYFTYFQHVNVKHAVYSLSYPRQHYGAYVDQGFGQGSTSNELFVGGGPLQLNLSGSYAGLFS